MKTHLAELPGIASALTAFSAKDCDPLSAQRLIEEIGELLGGLVKEQQPVFDYLCPVLRAGLPMTVGVSHHFPGIEVAPIHAKRIKSTGAIAVERIAPMHNGAKLLLVDTIAATGNTLVTLGHLLKAEWIGLEIMAAVGYASPQAIEAMREADAFGTVWIGRMATGVDPDGYLIPPTNGDAGEKLFGGMF